ncbi:Transferase [Parasponia andersonii]|uniref:Transferase n=1 Tax=Parasponia andersonii TaxID=3476 RepID=A0A2P5BX69_PARAD|nr:Transferase [Parasponia andersonii]
MTMIDIKVKVKTLVKPAEKTPRRSLWLSDLDMLQEEVRRATVLYLYKNDGASNFFDPTHLKEALAKVLVPYYPIAGRLRRVDDGRLEINCNEEGVLFIVAESGSVIDDLGDFQTSPELTKLTSASDYSAGISSVPLLVLQVTYFKCGGVSLSVGGEHLAVDGNSAFSFVNAWSEIARGNYNLKVRPALDRTLLRPRDPPQIMFNHTEYRRTDQSMEGSDQDTKSQHDDIERFNFKLVAVKIARDQINMLKTKAKDGNNTIDYSTFAILAGLIWKCTCIARDLPEDQETKLYFPANGRSRLQPPLPLGYFGNVVFRTTTVALAGDLKSKPLWYAASLVHKTLMRLDNDYLRSVIDFLKLHPNTRRNRLDESRSPNLAITSWANFSTSDADFGLGQPFHMGHCGILPNEGKAYIVDDGAKDGNKCVLISLQPECVKMFEKLFYESLI